MEPYLHGRAPEASGRTPGISVGSNRIVVVLVGSIDRRVLPAIHHAQLAQPAEIRAVHVAEDRDIAHELGLRWMQLGLTWLPLYVVEPSGSGLVDSVRRVVMSVVEEGYAKVTVLIPHLVQERRWHRLLHRHTGRRIAAALANVPSITVILFPYHHDLGT